MKHHRYIWALAATLLALSAAVLGARQAFAPAPDAPLLIDRAMALLEEDPAAWEQDTRSAIRAAAVEVEAGAVRSAEAYYVLALQYLREQNFTGSEALFKRAIAAAPEWSWPYVGLGNLLGGFAFGRVDEAVAALRRAAELDPAWSRPRNSLAIVLRLAGRYDEAEVEARAALELAPDSVATNTNYANLLLAMDRLEEARHYYKRAVEIDPTHAKPYYNLACLYSLLGEPEEAVHHLSRAIALSEVLRIEARRDPDFDPIRGHPAFDELVYVEQYRPAPPYLAPDTANTPALAPAPGPA